MLPFLKRTKEGSASSDPDHIRREPDDPADSYDPMHSAAGDLIQAMGEGNIKAVAEALRAAFELCDSEPHVEGPHMEED